MQQNDFQAYRTTLLRVIQTYNLTIDTFLTLPDWQKSLYFEAERERVDRLNSVMERLADKEHLTPEAYSTLVQSITG